MPDILKSRNSEPWNYYGKCGLSPELPMGTINKMGMKGKARCIERNKGKETAT